MDTNTSQKFNNGVLVGMSGGVDSSVTAALLMEQGYDVSGVTLRLYGCEKDVAKEEITCGSFKDVQDAKSVCDRLNLPHYVFDFKDRFKKAVIDKFCKEYNLGKTPNPCIDCNRFIKFSEMLMGAEKLNIPRIATGHYASVSKQGDTYILFNGRGENYFVEIVARVAGDEFVVDGLVSGSFFYDFFGNLVTLFG